MGMIVQKYGGTSLGTGERMRIVADIVERTYRKQGVIAVVSAMSSTIKSEGTTSLLLQAGDLAVQGADYDEPLEKIENHHRAAVEEAIDSDELRGEVETWIEGELTWLRSFLEAIEVIRELSPRSQDILMATGERFSAFLLSSVLRDRSVPARYVDLATVVPEEEREANNWFFQRLQYRLGQVCAPNGDLPVVTGFFGMVPGGLLKAVGRGYTDFTAALIAAALGEELVDEMQVWKEVDGVFTADPRRVPNARVLDSISPTEASELTYFGSEVLHPFTMERVISADIPIRIKNTFNPEGAGTVILPPERAAGESPHRVTAVTVKKGITAFTITSNRMYNAHGFMSRVFEVLNSFGVVVDLIATSEVSLSCTVDQREELDRAVPQLKELGTITLHPDRAILAMVGEGMKFATGTAGAMFTSLAQAGVNIEMISQGASEINISCVIKDADADKGLQAIHAQFME